MQNTRSKVVGSKNKLALDGGASFGPAAALVTRASLPASLVSLAADEEGAVWAAWDDKRADPARVQLARVDQGGVSRVARTVGRTPSIASGYGRQLLAVLDGEAVRVWTTMK